MYIWNKINKDDSLDLIIVSALYGLLDFREVIHDYSAIMNQTGRIWMEKNLFEILQAYVTENSITKIYNFLSKPYLTPLNGKFADTEIISICIWKTKGKLLGSASLGKKGKCLRELVLKTQLPDIIDGFSVTYQKTGFEMKSCSS